MTKPVLPTYSTVGTIVSPFPMSLYTMVVIMYIYDVHTKQCHYVQKPSVYYY